MTVEGNLFFGPKTAGTARDKVASCVASAYEILPMESLLQRKPAALSVGQCRYAAIGYVLSVMSMYFYWTSSCPT